MKKHSGHSPWDLSRRSALKKLGTVAGVAAAAQVSPAMVGYVYGSK